MGQNAGQLLLLTGATIDVSCAARWTTKWSNRGDKLKPTDVWHPRDPKRVICEGFACHVESTVRSTCLVPSNIGLQCLKNHMTDGLLRNRRKRARRRAHKPEALRNGPQNTVHIDRRTSERSKKHVGSKGLRGSSSPQFESRFQKRT